MATTMTYGDYSFKPVPMMQISIDRQKTRDGTSLGNTFNVRLEGSVTPLPTGTAGYANVDTLQDSLISSLNQDGQRFHVTCGGQNLLDVYPRINNLSFDPTSDNWVNRANYSVELEFDHNTPTGTPPYIKEASENWSLEFDDTKSYFSSDLSTVSPQYAGNDYVTDVSPYILKMTHDVSAVGKRHYSESDSNPSSGTLDREGWKEARSYVVNRLSTDNTFLASSGVINLDPSQFGYYNHVRTQNANELDGSFSVTESWLVMNTGEEGIPGDVMEDFTVDSQKSIDNDLTKVSINGRIEGLSTVDYGTTTGDFSITQSKYDAAKSGWNTIKTRLLPRAQSVAQTISSRPLHSGVKTTSIAHNPAKGIISYNYEYNDRPSNCITGALYEDISVVDNYPTDVVASLTVLGRSAGPILQDIGTVTAPTRNVNIEAVMSIGSGCTVSALLANKPTTQVERLLCNFEQDLSGTYDQVFLQDDSENWNPKTGRYSRNVKWIYLDCSNSLNTTFCS